MCLCRISIFNAGFLWCIESPTFFPSITQLFFNRGLLFFWSGLTILWGFLSHLRRKLENICTTWSPSTQLGPSISYGKTIPGDIPVVFRLIVCFTFLCKPFLQTLLFTHHNARTTLSRNKLVFHFVTFVHSYSYFNCQQLISRSNLYKCASLVGRPVTGLTGRSISPQVLLYILFIILELDCGNFCGF